MALLCHGSIFLNNLIFKIRDLKDLSAFTANTKKWKPDSSKFRIFKPYEGVAGFI